MAFASSRGGDPLQPLRQGEPAPLYLLHGKERFLVDRGVDLLRQRVLDPRTRDFNYDLMLGKEATAARILGAARTLPMMAKRRLVLVRDIDELKADELNGLLPYIERPAPETCLVLTGEKIDLRIKLFTSFKKHGVLIKLEPLKEWQLGSFLVEEAKGRGVRLEAGVAQLLADEIGAELGPLVDALERLATFVGDRRVVSVADVEAVVATTRQRSIFELCDAVGRGERVRSLQILGALLRDREPGVKILALLARQIRQLWTAQRLRSDGLSSQELAQQIGVPPFHLDGILEQAARLRPGRVELLHEVLFRADRDIKSSRLDDERLLERVILELTQPDAG
jgi:DNA polymerase-3 subunit delta